MMNSYDAFAPTQAEVDQYKEKLQNSKAEQKNLFLIIFQVVLTHFCRIDETMLILVNNVQNIIY